MWVLRAYDTDTDELEGEFPLPRFAPAQFNGAGEHLTTLGSTRIAPGTAKRLAEQWRFLLPERRSLEYFLDYDEEPEQTADADGSQSPEVIRAKP
jgi:hypothetical protein